MTVNIILAKSNILKRKIAIKFTPSRTVSWLNINHTWTVLKQKLVLAFAPLKFNPKIQIYVFMATEL